MRTLIFTFLACFAIGIANAQTTFESKIEAVKNEIQKITAEAKAILKSEVEDINRRLENNEITEKEANELKREKAEASAEKLQARLSSLEDEIQSIIRTEVEDYDGDASSEYDQIEADIRKTVENVKTTVEEVKTTVDKMTTKKEISRKYRNERRTTTQFVFGFGLNNALLDGSLSSLDNNQLKVSNSRFYEWGFTWKTRLLTDSPLLNLKYGLSLTYNNLRPDDNLYFEKVGSQTILTEFPKTLKDEPYFRMVNWVIPVHLEFDFSKKIRKDETPIVKTQRGFRVGIGGYAGVNSRAKQILSYREDNQSVQVKTKGGYNTNSFIYGLSGYIGYKDFSIYTKYDLNTIFSDESVKMNNVSLGIRFDFN